jgi:hypothetical protein
MKFFSLLILLFVCSTCYGQEQETDPATILRTSKGNLKVSRLFKESPVLPVTNKEAEIYRMSFLPTFYNPVKIRIEKHKNKYFIVAKRLSGQGGYDPGKLKSQKQRILKRAEWKRLITLLDSANFWKMPYLKKEAEPNSNGETTICLDGSEWVLEGVKTGKFHAVFRYCSDEKEYNAIGYYLVKISGLKINWRDL